MKSGEKTVQSLAALDAYAAEMLQGIEPQEKATIIALKGDLGAGKTTFVQFLARHLGVKEHITSPTFVIQKTYPLEGAFSALVHIDAYRLEGPRELLVLGFEKLLRTPRTLMCVEWPEKVSPLLDAVPTITFTHGVGDARVLTIEVPEGQ